MMQEQPLPTSPESLMARLSALGMSYTLHRHKPVFTCAESAFLRETIPGVHVKNLFLRDKKGRMALITVPDEINIDLKAIAPVLGMDRLSFGSPGRLWTHLGVRPGSVCPFAVMNDTAGAVRMVLDETAARAAQVSAHPMLNTMSVTMAGADLVTFLKEHGHAPQIIDLSLYARADAA